MSLLTFELVTPEGLKFSEDIYEVILPTAGGEIGVLSNHEPMVTIVNPGVIVIKKHASDAMDQAEHLATAGGFVEVDGHRVRLLADSAERAEDIDEMKAQEALTRAPELQQTNKDQVSLADATRLIQLNTARLKVAELKRRRRGR